MLASAPFVIAVLAACGSGARVPDVLPPASGPGAPVVGKPAPSFTLKATSGDTIGLDQLRGKVVLVNFWATWCVPCKTELPAIDAVQRRFGADNFVALAVDYREQDDVVERFGSKAGLSFPLLQDSVGSVAVLYRLVGVPSSYLIDREGVLRTIQTGPFSEKKLSELVNAAIKEAAQ
jgi:peroxiredoxin